MGQGTIRSLHRLCSKGAGGGGSSTLAKATFEKKKPFFALEIICDKSVPKVSIIIPGVNMFERYTQAS